MSRLGDWMSRAGEQLEAGMGLLNENEIFVRRARGIGVIDRETALRMCVTGPNLRASGVPFDIRRAHPYSVYPELDFDIPTRERGRLAGPLPAPDGRGHARASGSSTSASTRCPTGPSWRGCRGSCGRARAAPTARSRDRAASTPPTSISDGTDQPFRMRIHDPSFLHLQLVGLLMPGNLIADTMAIMASLDPVMGGVDK